MKVPVAQGRIVHVSDDLVDVKNPEVSRYGLTQHQAKGQLPL